MGRGLGKGGGGKGGTREAFTKRRSGNWILALEPAWWRFSRLPESAQTRPGGVCVRNVPATIEAKSFQKTLRKLNVGD